MINNKKVCTILSLAIILILLTTGCFKIEPEPSMTVTVEIQRDTIPILQIAQYGVSIQTNRAVTRVDFITDKGEASHSSVRTTDEKTYITNLFLDSKATELTIIGRDTSGKEIARQTMQLTHNKEAVIEAFEGPASTDGIYIKGDPLEFYSISYIGSMTIGQRVALLTELEGDTGGFVILAATFGWTWPDYLSWYETGTPGATPISEEFLGTYRAIDMSDGRLFNVLTGEYIDEDDFEVTFADPNLEQVVREVLHKPTGTIYKSDVMTIEYLSASQRGISNLSGIEHLENLEELYFWGNSVSDLSPVADLKNLRWLDFWNNSVSDLSPIAGLVNLEYLLFEDNLVEDISSLAELVNLVLLAFHSNKVDDLKPLAGLGSLQFLDLFSNAVSDLSPLAGLANLTNLYFDDNLVSDLSPIAGLEKLVRLWADGNLISDILPLSNLVNLVEVLLRYNEIADISPLVANPGLSFGDRVDIRNNYLDLTPGSENMDDIEVLIARGVTVDYEPQRAPEPFPGLRFDYFDQPASGSFNVPRVQDNQYHRRQGTPR